MFSTLPKWFAPPPTSLISPENLVSYSTEEVEDIQPDLWSPSMLQSLRHPPPFSKLWRNLFIWPSFWSLLSSGIFAFKPPVDFLSFSSYLVPLTDGQMSQSVTLFSSPWPLCPFSFLCIVTTMWNSLNLLTAFLQFPPLVSDSLWNDFAPILYRSCSDYGQHLIIRCDISFLSFFFFFFFFCLLSF